MGSHGTFDSNIPQKSRKASRLRVCRVFTKIASSDSIFFIPMKPGCFVYIYIYTRLFWSNHNHQLGRWGSPYLFSPLNQGFAGSIATLPSWFDAVLVLWSESCGSQYFWAGDVWSGSFGIMHWWNLVGRKKWTWPKLGGGFKYFLFSSLFREDEPILTSIFFGWVETTNQPKHWVF